MLKQTNAGDLAEDIIVKAGAEFRRLRIERGERLEDVADYLRIKAIYLYGIEQGDLSVMPNEDDVRRFVRSYADYLGYEGNDDMGRMGPMITGPGGKETAAVRAVGGVDRTSAIILAASVVLGGLAGWLYLAKVGQFDLLAPPVTAKSVDVSPTEDPVTDRDQRDLAAAEVESDDDAERALAKLKSETARVIQAETDTSRIDAEADAQTVDGQPSSVDAAAIASGTDVDADTVAKGRPANVLAILVAARGDGARIYEPQNTDARVIVRALGSAWVQISSESRDYVWTRTMQNKEMMLVPERDDLELWTSDAGGVEVLLDGVVLPPLGPPGQVLRGVSLDPKALEAILANADTGAKSTF